MQEMIVINKTEILGNEIQVFGDFDNPLFLAKDVCNWIEIKNHRDTLSRIDEDEKVVGLIDTLGGNQQTTFLTEDGLYEVLFQSRKPIAKEFKKQIKTMLKGLRKGELKLQPTKEEEKAQLLLSIYNGGQDGIVASKQLTEMEIEEATTPLIETIKEQEPAVEYHKTVTENEVEFDAQQLAKTLNFKKLGRNNILKVLRVKKILDSENYMYQKYISRGYGRVVETEIFDFYGRPRRKTVFTTKGMMYVKKKLIEYGYEENK